jgi:hypothetical protein
MTQLKTNIGRKTYASSSLIYFQYDNNVETAVLTTQRIAHVSKGALQADDSSLERSCGSLKTDLESVTIVTTTMTFVKKTCREEISRNAHAAVHT